MSVSSKTRPVAHEDNLAAGIPLDELSLLIKPLIADELKVEAASIEARSSGSLESTEDAQALAEEAREMVEQTVQTIETAIETHSEVASDGTVEQALTAAEQTKVDLLSDQADIALEASEEASISADKAVVAAESGDISDAARLSGETAKATMEATQALKYSSDVIDRAIASKEHVNVDAEQAGLEQTARLAAEVAQREIEDKKDILLSVNELRTQRTAISDRFNIVLDELSAKLGRSPEGLENEFILPFRLYVASVNTIKVDVTDTQSAMSNVLGWLLGNLVDRALKVTRITAELMRSVIVRSVRRITVMVGIVVGLTAMGFNIGPILAVIGAAGFVVAFALQDTLSNFASGIMIMIYRPLRTIPWCSRILIRP